MKIVAFIPARMAASRFPGKPLVPIHGRPMIEHVYRRTAMCTGVSEVYLATCDREIAEAVKRFGGRAVMTAPTHERCTDRVAEAADNIGTDADIVLNIQGDEPLLDPRSLDLLCAAMLKDRALQCANLMNAFTSVDDFQNPNQPKVVCDPQGFALYISRAAIPYPRPGVEIGRFRQLGVYAFTRETLAEYRKLSPTPLEQAESIDMMRFLEHGYRLRMVESPYPALGVDTPDDLRRVEAMMVDDPHFPAFRRAVGMA